MADEIIIETTSQEVIEVGVPGPQGATGPQGPAGAAGASAWNDITGKPATFAPSAHTHAASDITSGVLDNARINFAAPPAIGAQTPNTGVFTNLTASSRLNLPSSGSSVNDIWVSSGQVRYQAGIQVTSARTLLSAEDNLSTLTNAATARANLGLGGWATLSDGAALGTENLIISDGESADYIQFTAGSGVIFNGNRAAQFRGALGLGTSNNVTFGSIQNTPIGSTTPAAGSFTTLNANNDVEVTDSTKGVILKSPNNTRYRLTVSNSGLPIFTALMLFLLVSLAPAQNIGMATDTNGTILTDRTNAVTFTNPVAWNNRTNAATTISNLFSSNSLPSGAAPAGAVNTADGSGGSVFAGYVPGETFDFTTGSGPAGATAVTNGTTNVVWTWTAPTKFTRLSVILVGAGAGGGSGRVSDTNVAAFGGGGGSGGSITTADFPNMGGPLTITIPFGAAGGASQTTNNSNGLPGSAGGAASVAWTNGIAPRAGGGNNGAGGTTTSGAAGGSPSSSTDPAGAGGAASVSGNGNAGDLATGRGHIGGSAGGSITSTNTIVNGSSGRINSLLQIAAFGGVSTEGSVGQLAIPRITNSLFGNPGGGGGGASLTNNGGAGASPTTFGSGGGGGAAARNGFASGAGGTGGPGAVRIIGQ